MGTKKKILSAIFGAAVIMQAAVSDDVQAFSGTTSSAVSAATTSTVINSGGNNRYVNSVSCTSHKAQSDTDNHQLPDTDCMSKPAKDPGMDILYALLGITIMISVGSLLDYSWKRMTNHSFSHKEYPNLRRIFGPVTGMDDGSFTPLIHKLTKRNYNQAKKP